MKYPWIQVCLHTGLPVLLQRMELLTHSQDWLAGLRTHTSNSSPFGQVSKLPLPGQIF